MSRKFSRFVSSELPALTIAAASGLVQAGPNVLSPGSNAYGSYADLAAGWLEWALGIPGTTNPMLDTGRDFQPHREASSERGQGCAEAASLVIVHGIHWRLRP